MAPIATVVIPTYQRPEMLRLCLQAVERARSRLAPGAVDVVVSDDSRDDTTRALVQAAFPGVRYVPGPRRGPASNRNCGAALASSPWLVFTDDDCIPDETWLTAYLQAIEAAPGQPLFEGRTYADRPRRTYAEESPVNESGGFLWSCNMAIDTALFRRLGGFCESFPHPALEDVDFRLRLGRDGQKAVFVPQAGVCHPYRPMRGIEFFRKHTASYEHLLTLHPELQRSLTWRGIALNTVRILVSTLKNGLRYGLPGTGRVVYAAMAKARVDARVLRQRAQAR